MQLEPLQSGSKTLQITAVKDGHLLKRYGGQIDGKNATARIAVVPLGTTSSSIDPALKRNLTPNELDELTAYLDEITSKEIHHKAEKLAHEINEIATAVSAGIVEADSVSLVKAAAKSFLDIVEPGIFGSVKPKRPKTKSSANGDESVGNTST